MKTTKTLAVTAHDSAVLLGSWLRHYPAPVRAALLHTGTAIVCRLEKTAGVEGGTLVWRAAVTQVGAAEDVATIAALVDHALPAAVAGVRYAAAHLPAGREDAELGTCGAPRLLLEIAIPVTTARETTLRQLPA